MVPESFILPQTFQIGPFNIYFYGVIFALSVLAAYQVAVRLAPRRGLKPKIIEDIFLFTLPVAILGARLYHVFDLWSYYRHRPAEILMLWHGGLGIYGGILAGVVFLLVYCRWRRFNLAAVLDILGPALALGQAIGRWGNLFNQEAFGPPTNLPWGISIQPQYQPLVWAGNTRFHPLFLYESVFNLANFFLLYYLFKKTKKEGLVAGFYFINYGLIRFFLEFLRWDTWLIAGTKLAHPLSLTSIIFGLLLIFKHYH
jgi:phosphatidylglycerol:prolipoprotein diacylglycerol transferase